MLRFQICARVRKADRKQGGAGRDDRPTPTSQARQVVAVAQAQQAWQEKSSPPPHRRQA